MFTIALTVVLDWAIKDLSSFKIVWSVQPNTFNLFH